MQTIPANKELEKEKDVGVDEYGWPIGFLKRPQELFRVNYWSESIKVSMRCD